MAEYIIGVDEVGWGCIAGPLVVCACIVKFGHWDTLRSWGFRDSKEVGNRTKVSNDPRTRVSEGKCDALVRRLEEEGGDTVSWAMAHISPITIDLKTPAAAKEAAFRRAVLMVMHQNKLEPSQVTVIIDGKLPIRTISKVIQQHAEPKADDTILPVSVASVLAKSCRDRQMAPLQGLYPGYKLGENKGYPTQDHIRAVFDNGPIAGVHRMSYLKTTMVNFYNGFTDREKSHRRPPDWILQQGWLVRP